METDFSYLTLRYGSIVIGNIGAVFQRAGETIVGKYKANCAILE